MPNALEKVRIVGLDKDGKETGKNLVCVYNPESLSYRRAPAITPKNIPGKELAEAHRAGGGTASLSAKLLFDTTRALKMATDGVDVAAGADVRTYTEFFFRLMEEQAEGKPSFCRFEWGAKLYIIKGMLTSLDVNYVLFAPDGTPLRSEISISIEEQATLAEQDKLWQNPTSRSEARKIWVVQEGERLDYIAYREYGDSARWRHIAETNGIEDPFSLHSGQVLKLVPLP